MSCLLPQLGCSASAETPSPHFNQILIHLPKTRRVIYFRAQCTLSTIPPPTLVASAPVIDAQKLQLQSLKAYSTSITSQRPWAYTGTEENFQTREALLTSEDAVIAAAAAEMVALAKAAVKAAKDAAMMVNSNQLTELEAKSATISSEDDTVILERVEIGRFGESIRSETLNEDYLQYPIRDCVNLEPVREEHELLHAQPPKNITARSQRQLERKARRARAAEKAIANVVPLKSGSPSRKKRAALQDVDHSDPLRYLRGTTSTFKLLSATEEQECSEGIQDLLKLEKLHKELEDRYNSRPTFAQWASAAGVDQKTLRKRLNHGVLCKDKMIKSNIRLVISIAKNYQGAGMSIQDLVQEGCRGLVRGAEKFDASKGFKFSTYAHWWIKQSVRKSLSDQSRTIRLPFHMVEATYKVKEARKQFYSENGRHPDNEEVAEAAGLSMKRLASVLMTPKPPRSLDQNINNDMNLKPSEVISDPGAETAEEQLIKQFMRQDLEKVLDSLNPREKQVVKLRFGMEDGRMKTLQEIGESMGVSRERIRQIESSAFRKLKNKKRIKPLQQYLVS